MRNRQKANSKETSPSATSLKKSSQGSEPTQSNSISSAGATAGLPCFIHYQPPRASFSQQPFQPEPLPTPRDSPDYAQDQYAFNVSVSNGINASTLLPNSFLFSPEVTSPSEVASSGDYLSTIHSIEAQYLYWDTTIPEIENSRSNQSCSSPQTRK